MARIRNFEYWGLDPSMPLRPDPARPLRFKQTMPADPEVPTPEEKPLPVGPDVSRPFTFKFMSSWGTLGGACHGKAQVVRNNDDPFVVDPMSIIPKDVLKDMGLIRLCPSVSAYFKGMLTEMITLANAGREDLIERLASSYASACRFSAYPQASGIGGIWMAQDVARARAVLDVYAACREHFQAYKGLDPTERKGLVQEDLRIRQLLNQALCWDGVVLKEEDGLRELWFVIEPKHHMYPDGKSEFICYV